MNYFFILHLLLALFPILNQVQAQQIPMSSKKLDTSKEVHKIAFGSCGDPYKDMNIWNSIKAEEPDLFLYIGDNVYQIEEKNLPELKELRDAYNQLAINPEFKRLRSSVPILTTWDDHDFGLNDAGGDWPYKAKSQEIYYQAWDIKQNDPRRHRGGVYHSVMLGERDKRLQIILLDTRYFRSPLLKTDQLDAPYKERYLQDHDNQKTMLGSEQWDWLKEQLSKPANLRLIVSSIQIIADGHGWESWRTLPKERQKLYRLISETKSDGVIFLSGDRHSAAFYEETENLPYPITEITSSSLNDPLTGFVKNIKVEPGPKRLVLPFYESNYGVLQIDWDNQTVKLSINNTASEKVRTKSINFKELQSDS